MARVLATRKAEVKRVERTGERIAFEGMTVKECLMALVKMEEQDQQVVKINASFPAAHFVDGLLYFQQALIERWGEFYAEPGAQGEPPTLLDLQTAPGVTTRVVWGEFTVPGIEGKFKTGVENQDGRPVFRLSGSIKQKYSPEIGELVERVHALCKQGGIYKGKALELPIMSEDGWGSPLEAAPAFMALSDQPPPIFNREIQESIDRDILEDIEAGGLSRSNGLPLKKGILLAGPPGTGKTLLAHQLARKCVEHGWTFVYLRDASMIAAAVREAQRSCWEPAYIFAEDVDRVVGQDRTEAVNEVLNTIDGIGSKGSQIVVLFTTNSVEVIHQAMLRPERIDVLIPMEPPGPEAVEELVRREAAGGLSVGEDLEMVGRELAGMMPAVVVQAVQRARRGAQRRERLAGLGGENPYIDAGDLLSAARSMTRHIALLTPRVKEDKGLGKALEVLGRALRQKKVEVE